MLTTEAFLERFQKNLWDRSPKVTLLAVSGGIDSMVMADLFLTSQLPFAIAHCNFQLRGAEADADEALVKTWCDQHHVPFYTTHFDTQYFSALWKKGIQETARKLRYDWFSKLCKENDFKYLATAHHGDDAVETLLINLCKGTGLHGLASIPVQNQHIIRPLLFTNRAAIKTYAELHQIAFREDASNADDKYLRNAVRHQIVPTLEQQFPNATERIRESIIRFSQAAQIYDRAVSKIIAGLVEQRGKDFYIPIRKLQKVTPLETIVYELFKVYQYTAPQTKSLIVLMDADSGKYVESSTHKTIKNREFLIITQLQTNEADFIAIDTLASPIKLSDRTLKFSSSKLSTIFSDDPNVTYVDAQKLEAPILLRRWKQGDYFYPLGMGMKKKKLSRFFIDAKIPLHEKEQCWVLESNKRIVWIAGMRLDERFKITDKTTEVLKIEMRMQ